MRWLLRSKIHNATVTDAHVGYVGSITLDADLVERSGLMEGEKVLVADTDNGARVETYVIVGERGPGQVCINGAAARLIRKGHHVIVMGFELADGPVAARTVLGDEHNRFVRLM